MIIAGFLLSIVVIAELNSWYYLLLYIPIGMFVYHAEAINFRKKKHEVAKKRISR